MSNKYALCIGINDYPGTQNDLSGCINDCNDWAAVLKSRGFIVQKLQNSSATKKNIIDSMQAIIQSAVSGDSVIFQYSGHGSFVPDENGDEPDGKDECICPYDINRGNFIIDDELFDLYEQRSRGVKLVMISDSCHSGTVTRFAPISTPPSVRGSRVPRRKVRFLPPSVFLKGKELAKLGISRAIRASSPPGKYSGLLMAGCQDTEYSYDAVFDNKANGAFSYVALEALKKTKENTTYADWFKAIAKILPSTQYPQTPRLFGAGSMKKWKILQ